jgi:nucleoside-diphosphate-sugar epimerase
MGKGLVLVDGAAGYLGRRVVEEFLSSGYRVRATDLPQSDLSSVEKLGAEVVGSNLLDLESLIKVADGVDYVVHCAALFSLDAKMDVLRRVNVDGTKNLLEASKRAGVKHFIHVSSSDIYGTLKKLPGDEAHPQNPINDYAKTKKESEDLVWQYAKEGALPVSIVRPSAIYGPGSVYIAGVFFFWPIFMKFLRVPFYPYIRGGSKLTFVHVDDVAGAIGFLIGREDAFSQAYNLADTDYIYSANFACELCKTFGIRNMFRFSIPLPHLLVDLYGKLMLYTSGPVLKILNKFVKKRWLRLQEKYGLYSDFIPHFERQFYSYFIGHRYFSSQKIISLGYKFKNRSFYQGFPDTFKWYVDNKWLPPIEKLGKKVK